MVKDVKDDLLENLEKTPEPAATKEGQANDPDPSSDPSSRTMLRTILRIFLTNTEGRKEIFKLYYGGNFDSELIQDHW